MPSRGGKLFLYFINIKFDSNPYQCKLIVNNYERQGPLHVIATRGSGIVSGFTRILISSALALGMAGAAQAQCVGNCGTASANGDITASPLGGQYNFVSTSSGIAGAGQLAGIGGVNGWSNTTSIFSAEAGSTLSFYFNYVTSDGSGFSDYAWSQLQTAGGTGFATLFSARTTPIGNTVPGFGLPPLLATLQPATTPIQLGAFANGPT